MTDQPSVTIDQASAAQRSLRRELGLGEEHFPMPEFIGMLSDEIEKMRLAGRSDAETAEIVSRAAGIPVSGEDITRHYGSLRHRGG